MTNTSWNLRCICLGSYNDSQNYKDPFEKQIVQPLEDKLEKARARNTHNNSEF